MFTGIIEEVGRVVSREEIAGGIRLGIEAREVFSDLSVGDSIAVN
ncbi:MAG: riboflavin synthase, partial [Calditrichaeota bacterium]